MSDDAFAELCAAHPDVVLEMTADHELIVRPPNFTLTGIRNREILAQLDRWAAVDGRGISADASAGGCCLMGQGGRPMRRGCRWRRLRAWMRQR